MSLSINYSDFFILLKGKGNYIMKNKLSSKAKISWFIPRAIYLVIIIAVSIAVRLIFSGWVEGRLILDLVLGVIVLFQLINTVVYPILEYKQWSYEIDEDKVECTQGIYKVISVVTPTIRIQHIAIIQGPIDRLLGLADLHIATAGGSFEIPNLDKEEAEMLSSYLKNIVQFKIKNDTDNLGDNNEK